MEKEQEIVTLLMAMVIDFDRYGDEIGYTKQELDNFIEKYDLYNLDYSPNNAMDLYDKEYLSKEDFVEKIRDFLDWAENGDLDNMDTVEYVEFLEKNNLIDICIDKMKHDDIKKDDDGTWYFYAKGGWSYFSEYFSVDRDYRDDVVKMILSGDGYGLFDYDCTNFDDFSYVDVNEENLKYLKTIVQNMKDDFEIEQDDIDDISDLSDVASVAKEYDLDDLVLGLKLAHCRAQGYADESEAYESATNEILNHFGLTLDGMKWVKDNDKSKYGETLKIKFNSESDAKDAMVLLYKLNNSSSYDDTSDYLIKYSSPYNGWHGDVDKFIDEEIQERVPDYVDGEYLP